MLQRCWYSLSGGNTVRQDLIASRCGRSSRPPKVTGPTCSFSALRASSVFPRPRPGTSLSSITSTLGRPASRIHPPTSDRLRWSRLSADSLFVASIKTLSGLRSPTNREADSSTSCDATNAAEEDSSFCSAESGESGGRLGPGALLEDGCGCD